MLYNHLMLKFLNISSEVLLFFHVHIPRPRFHNIDVKVKRVIDD